MFGLRPKPPERTSVHVKGPSEHAPAPDSIRVCVWNVQYAASREQLFFYDGGTAVSVRRNVVLSTLESIARTVEQHDADLVLLQEVDRGSRRTGFIDQHAWLAERLAHPWSASTPYHQCRYVPVPSHEPLGRVDMHLSMFSRFALLPGTRVQLPLLQESWIRRQFNLRRALMAMPLQRDGSPLMLLHTHLSAFSHGDGTVTRQIAKLTAEAARAQHQGMPWLLAGDFNALPPGDDPGRLGDDATMYATPSPLAPLFAAHQSAVPLDRHSAEPQPWRTWVPFGAQQAQRALDHAFASSTCSFTGTHVDTGSMGLSDHLPLLFDLKIS